MDSTIADCYYSVNSILHIPSCSNPLFNELMQNKEIRRLNLLSLEREYGTLEAVAARTETVASHLSQIKNKTRGMGDKVARRIEASLARPQGWMDAIHTTDKGNESGIFPPLTPKEEVLLEYIRGLTPHQQDELLPALRATFDANRITQAHLHTKLQTIGNATMEQKYGLPDKAVTRVKVRRKPLQSGRPPDAQLDDYPED
jgi:hypothetical protein